MSAPVHGRRPSRFTFNIPSPAHAKQQQQPAKHTPHPPPPPSFSLRKQHTARRRKVATPHPLVIHKPAPTVQTNVARKAAFIDYSLSLQFSPSFSPSSCVISGVPLPDTPTSPTDSPMSDMRQRRWSLEMRRDSNDYGEDEEQDGDEEDGQDDEDEQDNIMSPNLFSSSSCSFLSPLDSSSSLDTPITSPPPASTQPPTKSKSPSPAPTLLVPSLPPHRRINSDPLPAPSTSSASSIGFKLHLRPLVIPPSKDGDAIVMLSSTSPLPLSQLTDRQDSYECYEQPCAVVAAEHAGVDELLHGRPMTLSECWYGRSELMSPVTGAGMMYMAAQQNKSHHHMPFSLLCYGTAAAV